MAQTQIPFGHPLARKVFGAALFAEMVQKPGFTKNLTGPAPSASEARAKLEKMQTSAAYPIVRVTDLSTGAGRSVSVDMFNILQGKPVMGDRKLAGRMMSLSSSSMDITINQIRAGVDSGGRMARQATVHDLRTIGLAGLAGWYARFSDQIKLVHIAGARGSQNDPTWVVPLDSDPEFNEIVVNSVQAPTKNRTFYAGGKARLDALTSTDIITLDDIDRLRASIDEMTVPLQPIVLDGETIDDAFFCLFLSPRQYHYLVNRSDAKGVRQFQQNAAVRGSANPLFKGEVGVWNGIVVKKLPRAIRFAAGDSVTVTTNDTTLATEQQVVPAFGGAAGAGVDRGILLGAQAVAEVWGQHSRSGTHFSWHEETSDHDNTMESSVSAIGGYAKLRFKTVDGETFDHGVAVVDSYAPDPRYVTV